jgi:hypothetical protein
MNPEEARDAARKAYGIDADRDGDWVGGFLCVDSVDGEPTVRRKRY